ncbi:MAG TPA: hypothetical protein VGC67_06040 [Cellulomonas sp.]
MTSPAALHRSSARLVAGTAAADPQDALECTTVVLPLGRDDPDGETITPAVNRHAATGEKIGSLLTDPGGPGGSGPDALLEHVDTASAAQDVDVLRAVPGDEKRSGVGFSSGTRLGATCAALFPQRVGRWSWTRRSTPPGLPRR